MFKYRLLITTSIVGILSLPAIAAETQADETIAALNGARIHELFIAKKADDIIGDEETSGDMDDDTDNNDDHNGDEDYDDDDDDNDDDDDMD